jgi:hypothetical protein
LEEPQRIKEVRFAAGIRAYEQIEMAELEIDALQAFEVADLQFRDHGYGLALLRIVPALLSFLPGPS